MKPRVLVDSRIKEEHTEWFQKTMQAFEEAHWLGYFHHSVSDDSHWVSVTEQKEPGYFLTPEQFAFIEDTPLVGREVKIIEGQYKGYEGILTEVYPGHRVCIIKIQNGLDIAHQLAFNSDQFLVIK